MIGLCRWFARRRPMPAPKPAPPVPIPCAHGVTLHRVNAEELDGCAALGVRHVRVTYYTRGGTAAAQAPQWQARLDSLDADGLQPLIVVHDFDDLEQAVVEMAELTARFPGRTWQVGNEYDAFSSHWASTGGQYAVLMQRVVAACPAGTRFAGMGLASAEHDLVRQPAFLRDYLAAHGPALEAWCLHAYGAPVLPALQAKVKATQAVLGDRYPLWITEYGIESASQELAWGPRTDAQVDEEHRATVAQVTANAGVLGVSRTYHYCYWDGADCNFGLVRRFGYRRPAWYALQAVQELRA